MTGEVRNAHRMNQHEIRVWYFVGRVRRKTSPTWGVKIFSDFTIKNKFVLLKYTCYHIKCRYKLSLYLYGTGYNILSSSGSHTIVNVSSIKSIVEINEVRWWLGIFGFRNGQGSFSESQITRITRILSDLSLTGNRW